MAIVVENIKKNWDRISVDFSCSVENGEMLAITGHSGSGKSTVLKMIAGLLDCGREGRILVDGKDVSRKTPGERNIGMVFQTPALFEHMNVVDNVSYALAARGINRKARHAAASDFLDMFGLSGFEKRMPATLSGGEAQRVSLARTLIARPQVVLFDEPFSALDPPLRRKLGAELVEMQKKLGFAGIMVTHDMQEAVALSDFITVMNQGRTVWHGPTCDFDESFLTQPNAVLMP
ncbi:MAG: ABC transporter ATP-binding protein [Treponemataceae bacterium]|nr:ABC transporter ATP-binding protein [Treponemataceae bacterium]